MSQCAFARSASATAFLEHTCCCLAGACDLESPTFDIELRFCELSSHYTALIFFGSTPGNINQWPFNSPSLLDCYVLLRIRTANILTVTILAISASTSAVILHDT